MAEEKSFEEELREKEAKEREQILIADYIERTHNAGALDQIELDVESIQQGIKPEIWKTGFAELDKKLDGGIVGDQLIFLGAISSAGKTTFALNLGAQIAEQGKDVLIFSLEMSKKELNAKMISRYSYQQSYERYNDRRLKEEDRVSRAGRESFTAKDVIMGRVGSFGSPEKERFDNALSATRKLNDHLYIVVGDNDINVDKVDAIINLHIKATGNRPFVVIDYLQIMQMSESTKESRVTDKRLSTDSDVTTLKTITRKYNIPMLVISSFNRNSYLEPVSISSFKESGGIEYSSDILLAMQYDGMDYQKHPCKVGARTIRVYESKVLHDNRIRDIAIKAEQNARNKVPVHIELKILKYRLDPKNSLYFDFMPAFNDFRERDKSGYVYKAEDYMAIPDDEVPFEQETKKSAGKPKAQSSTMFSGKATKSV